MKKNNDTWKEIFAVQSCSFVFTSRCLCFCIRPSCFFSLRFLCDDKIQCYSVQETYMFDFSWLISDWTTDQHATMTNWREFRPQHNLLNSKFDGYRLSLEPLAQYTVKFADPLRVQKDAQLDKDLYSLNGIKAFKSINQLYINPWKDQHELYFFDQTYSIQCISISANDSLSHLRQPTSVYQLPTNSLYGSMTFISDSIVLLSDGRSKLLVLNASQPKWKLLHEEDFDEFVTPPIRLLHAVLHEKTIHAVIGCLENGCQLLWATLSLGASSSDCQLIRRRALLGKRWPDFLAIESNGEGVYIAAEQTYKFTFDSLVQVSDDCEDWSSGSTPALEIFAFLCIGEIGRRGGETIRAGEDRVTSPLHLGTDAGSGWSRNHDSVRWRTQSLVGEHRIGSAEMFTKWNCLDRCQALRSCGCERELLSDRLG